MRWIYLHLPLRARRWVDALRHPRRWPKHGRLREPKSGRLGDDPQESSYRASEPLAASESLGMTVIRRDDA